MYPDLMDVTRKATGEAIEGAFSAIWLFGQKAANALAPLILGAILGSYGWQETTEGKIDQLPEAISALHVSITLLPAAVLGLAIVGLVLVYRRSLANVQSAAL
jgi:GPH family glycoside/pentoside/hexuronide:cation symporter